ncbi:MAG: aminofutalosine synthase MqnE [Thermoguttaceae bacterium]|jgi:aminodeoxyfutalosine synthase
MLASIRDKIESNNRLSAAEGEYLFREDVDLHAVGRLADAVRRRKNGDAAYYNVNSHLNPTNICLYRCPLCAYSCNEGDPRANVMTDEEILARGREAADAGCTELHVVGGVHPGKEFSWYAGILGRLHEAFPKLHLKAFTAVEIAWFSQATGRPVRAILEELIEAGLGSLPGGGAEIFDPAVRAKICPRKADAATWLSVHRTAHQLGLRSNASMLYGHLETAAQRIDHLLRLRKLQDETGGFQALIPLAFHPQGTAMSDLEGPFALLNLRTIAVSRLMLDNFDHIKAYWISLGVGTAQVALCYGADDLDGTVRHERIHHDAGAGSPEALPVDEIRRLITEAGFEPVERDSLYRRVERVYRTGEKGITFSCSDGWTG